MEQLCMDGDFPECRGQISWAGVIRKLWLERRPAKDASSQLSSPPGPALGAQEAHIFPQPPTSPASQGLWVGPGPDLWPLEGGPKSWKPLPGLALKVPVTVRVPGTHSSSGAARRRQVEPASLSKVGHSH